MKHYYVYILRCRDHSYYTGVTNNVEKRIAEHQLGEDLKSYTYSRRPVELVFCEEFNDINQAIAFEKQVKGWTRKKKEAIIAGSWDKLKELSFLRTIVIIEISELRLSRASTPLSLTKRGSAKLKRNSALRSGVIPVILSGVDVTLSGVDVTLSGVEG